MKKRGQAAIFMILAIVLLLLGVVFFYTSNLQERKIDISNPQAVSAKNFIETCIEQVSDRAFRILGTNGGYITFPEQITSDSRSYLKTGPLEEIKTPYWWFDGKKNIPTEEFMVDQIQRYIKANLDSCIDDLSQLQYIGLKRLDTMEVSVTLNSEDVTVLLNYPLQLEVGENRSRVRLTEFTVNLPIRFKRIFDMAKDIMASENNNYFLEYKTIDLISMDENIPTTDIEVTCQEKTWLVSDVERKLKRLLSTNLAYVNIVGSEHNSNVFVPNPFGGKTYADSYFNAHYTWKISDKSYDGLKVALEYNQKWPMKFYARPSSNGIMRAKPQVSQDILRFFCMHIWHFTYDVIYPVKVSIRDTKGFDPYQFSFAFMVSLDHNSPKRESLAFSLFDALEGSNRGEFCNDRVHEMTIFTIENSSNAKDITDVNLTYVCGIYSCPLGKTEWLSYGAASGFMEKFPFCSNGIIRATKENYLERRVLLQTEKPASLTLYMTPIKKIPVEVVKHADNTIKKLDSKDIVSISLKSQGSFESYISYPGELPLTLLADDQKYMLSLMLSDGETITGGYEGEWQVNKDALTSAQKVVFHVIEKKGSEEEFLTFFQNLKENSKKVPSPEIT